MLPLLARPRRRRSTSLAQQILAAAGGSANVTATFLYGVNATVAGGTISAWADANGGTPTVTQATGSQQPTDDGTAYVWGGVTKQLAGAFTYNGPQTIIDVVKQNGWTNNLYVYDGFTVDKGAMFQKGVSPQLQMYQGAFFNPATGPAVSAWAVVTATFNGASSSIQINNDTAVTGNAGTAANMAGIALGGTSGTNAGNISRRAIVLCAGTITAGQILAVKTLLYSAYGITP